MKDHKGSVCRKLLISCLKHRNHPRARAFEPLHHRGMFVSASHRLGYLRLSLEPHLGANDFDVGELWQIMLEPKLGPGFSHFFIFTLNLLMKKLIAPDCLYLGPLFGIPISRFLGTPQ